MLAKENIQDGLDKIFLKGYRPFLWITGLVTAVYFQILFFGFAYFDDEQLILESYSFISRLSNIPKAFQEDVFHSDLGTYYRPLLTVSFMIDAWMGGENPFVYHLTNMLLHALSCSLLFIILCNLRGDRKESFFVTLLYAVHPVLTQAVAWIPGRNDSMLTIFILASFVFFIRCINTRKGPAYFLHLFFLFLALLTKETAVVFPLICFSYLFFFRRSELFSYSKIRIYAGWFVLGIVWLVLRRTALVTEGSKTLTNLDSLPEILSGCLVFMGKIFFPLNLSAIPVLKNSTLIYGILAVVLFTLLLIKGVKDRKYFLLGAIWFLVLLFPTLALRRVDETILLEHRLHLPLVGFFIMLMELKIFSMPAFRKISLSIYVMLLILCSVKTLTYSRVFSDGMQCWKNAVANSPDYYLAHYNLGYIYARLNRLDEAERSLIKSIALKPSHYKPHNNLGVVYFRKKKFPESEREYTLAVQLNPRFAEGMANLGDLYNTLGRYEQALKILKHALHLKPELYIGYYNLGNVYFNIGDYKNAIVSFEQTIRLRPDFIKGYRNLGNVYLEIKNYDMAFFYYRKMISLNPKLAEGFVKVGYTHYELSRYDSALYSFQQALLLNPNEEINAYILANTYMRTGNTELAISNFKDLLRKDTTNTAAYYDLSRAFGIIGAYDSTIYYLKKVLAWEPENARVYWGIGLAYREKGDPVNEKIYLNKAYELDPELRKITN